MVFRRSSLRVLLVIGLIGASPAGPLIADSGASAAGPGSILYTYDDLGRLSAAVDPAGAIARYTYDAAGNITKITRGTLPNLAVVDVSPSHGPVGSTVSIYGRGFSPTKANDTVRFNGTVATVTSASTSRLAVKVPKGTTTGPVKVTTRGTTATGPVFTVIPSGAPVVSSFSPSIAALGATVTINGQKFQPDPVEDIVAFGAGRASVTSATATRITAKLPTSAASGKVSVTTPFGTGVGAQDLFVPPAPYTPAQVAVATRMILDSNKVVSLPASKVAMVLFDGAGGARFLLQLTNVTLGSSSCCSATVAVFQPNGSRLVPPQDFGTNGGVVIDTTALPRTGTYALLIDPGTNTGNATLHLKTVPPDPSATIIPGGPGVTLNMPSPGQVGRMTFAGTAGTRVAMDLSSVTVGPSSCCSMLVSLIGPDNLPLVNQTFAGTSGTFIDTVALATTGTYTIVLDPVGTATGSAKVKLFDVPNDVSMPITPGGSPVAVTTTTPGQNALLHFTGTMNQRISVQATNVTIGASGCCTALLSVLKPDGSPVDDTFIGPIGGFLDTVTLPVAGAYTILVDPQNEDVGSATIKAFDVPADAGGPITPGGAAVPVHITTPGQNARLTFSDTANNRVSAIVSGVTIGTSSCCSADLALHAPDDSHVGDAFVGTSGGFLDVQTIPATGTSSLVLDPLGTDVGDATIQLLDVPPDPEKSVTSGGPPATVTTTTPGQNAAFTFTGTAGNAMRLTFSSVSIGTSTCCSMLVTVFKPDQTQLMSNSFIGTDGGTIDTIALPTTGTYRVFLDPQDTDTGSATMGLQTLPIPPPAPSGTDAPAPATTAPPVPAEPPVTVDPAHAAKEGPAVRVRGLTSVVGTVVTQDGQPLPGVRVEIDGVSTVTNASGLFRLGPVAPGHHEMTIDARPAGHGGARYGTFVYGVDLTNGRTTYLLSRFWMPVIDMRHSVRIGAPTAHEVVLTTPDIPGLEVHIPAGSTITDDDGNVVHRLSLTAVPVDKPPFPLPMLGPAVPVYFTVQPGGSYVLPKGAWVVYPNYFDLPSGARADFWNYDPEGRGWHVYGQGTVTPDGKQVVPDPGTRIWTFDGAMFNGSGIPGPATGPPPGNSPSAGDPVDLATGLFVWQKTDLTLPDTLPLSLTRVYRPADSVSRAFGIGQTFNYDMYLYSQNQYTEVDLFLPDGGKVHFVRTSPGTSYVDAVFTAENTPTIFLGATMVFDEAFFGWRMKLRDGTVLSFPTYTPLTSIEDRNGNEITIERNDNKRPIEVTSPHDRSIDFTYDASARITQARDNGGRTWQYAYDPDGHLTTVTDPLGNATHYNFDANGRMVSVVDARGSTVLTNVYDANDRVTRQTLGTGGEYDYEYTLAGGKVTATTVTDPDGHVEEATFNDDGYLLTDTAAMGTPLERTVTTTRQAGTNLPLTVTDPAGRITTYTYDANDNVTQVTQLSGSPNAVSTSLTYQPKFNLVTSITDPLNHATHYAYDAHGDLTTITDPLGHTQTYAYDPETGQVLSYTNGVGKATTFGYNGGDLVSMTDPTGVGFHRFYDALGQLLSSTDSLGNTTSFKYDAVGRVVQATDAAGKVTSYAYDKIGDLVGETDPLHHTTHYAYDAQARLTSQTDPLSRTETYAYDPAGHLVTYVDRRGLTTSLGYDALNRLESAGFGKNGASFQDEEAFTYDLLDRMTGATDSVAGAIARTYDNLDRLTQETSPQGTVTYAYDAGGRRTSMHVAGLPAVQYTFDAADRMTGEQQGSVSVAVAYDNADRPTAVTLPGGVKEAWSYDAGSRVKGITVTHAGTNLGTLAYQRGLDGHVRVVNGTLARLNLPVAVSSATYDAADELTNWGGAALSYDLNGNLVHDGPTTYTWDARNHLASVAGGTTASYRYDAFGRRVLVTTGGSTTGYLYDHMNPAAEVAGSTPTVAYLAGQFLDQWFTRTSGTQTRSYISDPVGSVVGLVNSSGSFTTSYTYDPFGATTSSGASSTNPFQFTGRQRDTTGLSYLRDRYYSPRFDRFVSQDRFDPAAVQLLRQSTNGTVRGFPADGRLLNGYTYVLNGPTVAPDPTGLCYPWCTAAAGAIGNAFGAYISGGSSKDIVRAAVIGAVGGFVPVPGGMLGRMVTNAFVNGLGEFYNEAWSAKQKGQPFTPNWTAIGASAGAGLLGGELGNGVAGEVGPLFQGGSSGWGGNISSGFAQGPVNGAGSIWANLMDALNTTGPPGSPPP